MANSSVSTILTRVQGLLKIDMTTIAAPGLQQDALIAVLNDANAEWRSIFRRAGGDPPLVFQKQTGGTVIASTTLTAAQVTSDVTAALTTVTSFPTSGAIAVYTNNMSDIEEYSGISSLTLTGVTGIDFAHAANDEVTVMYKLPTNFKDFRRVEGSGDGVMVNGVAFYYVSGTPLSLQFSIYDNGTNKFLWLPRGTSGSWEAFYNSDSTNLSALTDLVDVPNTWEWALVYRVVAYGHRVKGSDPARSEEADKKADQLIYRAQMEQRIRKGVTPRVVQPRNRVIYTSTGVITL